MKKIIFGITITTALLLAGFFGGESSDVSGEAFLRTKGGSVITCAGSPVYIEKANPGGYVFLTNTIKVKKDYVNVLSTINNLENNGNERKLRKLEDKLQNTHYSEKRLLQRLEDNLKNGSSGSSDETIIFIKKQLEQAELANNSKNLAYWKKRLNDNSPELIKKRSKQQKQQLEQQIEQTKERRKTYLEKIRKVKEENKEKAKEGSKKILVVEKEIYKLEERLKNVKKEDTKETMCNSQGQFVFTGLSPDTYYISTTVQWSVGDEKQGGTVSKTIILNEGENKIFITK